MELTVLHMPSRGIGKAISAGFAKEAQTLFLLHVQREAWQRCASTLT